MIKSCFVVASLFAAFSLPAGNLLPGDSSAEAESDSLTQGIHTQVQLASADDRDAYDGKRSILINWDGINRVQYAKVNDSAGYLNRTVCTRSTEPLEAGKKYVCSFYAKAEKAGMTVQASALPDGEAWIYVPGAKVTRTIHLTTDWRRYELPFTAGFRKQTRIHTYALMLDLTPCIPGKIRLDAVQFEAGSQAGAYRNAASVTAGAELFAESPAHIFFTGKPVKGAVRVAVHGKNDAGQIKVRLSDYRGNTVKTWQVPCKAEIHPFALDGLEPGWYRLMTTVGQGDRILFTHDTAFVCVVPPGKLADGMRPYLGTCGGAVAELQKLGTRRMQLPFHWYGSRWGVENERGKIDWTNFSKRLDEAKKYGMSCKVNVNVYSTPPWFYTGDEAKLGSRVPPPESYPAWFGLLREMLKRFGDKIDEIEFGAEDNGRLGLSNFYKQKYPEGVERDAGGQGWLVKGKAFDDLMNFERLACLEVGRHAPHIRTSVLRPSQGRPEDHWFFVRKALQKIGRGPKCFGVDTYCAIPYYYGPDIKSNQGSTDDRFETFRRAEKWLKEYNGVHEIFISECGTAVDVRCADDSPYRIRQCEQMARDLVTSRCAGFYAFDWFQGINYFPCLSHTPYCFSMIHNGRIQSIAAAYSAAGHILENVKNTRFLTPDDSTRIAVFEKADGSGTAAVWGENGNFADLTGFVLTDLMGKKIQPGNLELSPAPLCIRHPDFRVLLEKLRNLKITMADPCLLTFAPDGGKSVLIRFVNRRKNLDFASDVKFTENGRNEVRHLAIPGGCALRQRIRLTGSRRMVEVEIGKKKTAYTVPEIPAIAFGKTPVSILDVLNDRTRLLPADPWIPWKGPEDFSYRLLGSWDENALHLCVEVKDDSHFSGTSPWKGDGIQLAIDGAGNGRFSGKHDDNDLEIGLCLPQGGPVLIRSVGKAEIKQFEIRRDEQKKITRYQVAIPWKELGITPEAGKVIGISAVAYDDDTGKGIEYYGRTGAGITGEKRPDLYRPFILEEK